MDSDSKKEVLITSFSNYVHNLYETQKAVAPMLMGHNPEKNEVIFIPLEFANDSEKSACFRTVEVCLWLFECKSYFFHTEAWMSKIALPEGEKLNLDKYPRPENDPNRIEIVQMGYADTGNHKEGRLYEIKRTPGVETVTLRAVLSPAPHSMSGRMFSFLEKTNFSSPTPSMRDSAREMLKTKGITPRPFSVIQGGKNE